MQSFTQIVQRDITGSLPAERSCVLSMLAALLSTSGARSVGENGPYFEFTCESEEVAAFMLELVRSAFGVTMTVKGAVRDPKKGKDKLTFCCEGEGTAERLAEIEAHGLSRLTADFRADCAQAYLAGSFLGGGSCTLPRGGVRTGYHLEFVIRTYEEAILFLELLDRFQLIAGAVNRGERAVVYLKSREAIGDFLSVVGADSALRRLESVSAAREESNNRNRVENCTAGNADRAAIASASQIVAIREMAERGTLSALPEPLRAAAEARMNAPALSLGELAETLGISKSCLNHRLRKLMRIHEENDR